MDPSVWDVLATIGQVAAGFGALALLWMTRQSSKTASTALAAAGKLATSNEELVRATTARADLSVRPVLEAAAISTDGRELTLHNGGLGPLVNLRVTHGGSDLDITLDSPNHPRTSILRPGERVRVLLPHGDGPAQLEITGVTLLGVALESTTDRQQIAAEAPLVLPLVAPHSPAATAGGSPTP